MTEKDCNDYIKREDVIEALLLSNRFSQTGFYSDEVISDTIEAAVKAVEILPAADVVPVAHGKWIDKTIWFGKLGVIYTQCSNCGYETQRDIRTLVDRIGGKYCGNCGAKMDDEGE